MRDFFKYECMNDKMYYRNAENNTKLIGIESALSKYIIKFFGNRNQVVRTSKNEIIFGFSFVIPKIVTFNQIERRSCLVK